MTNLTYLGEICWSVMKRRVQVVRRIFDSPLDDTIPSTVGVAAVRYHRNCSDHQSLTSVGEYWRKRLDAL